MVEIFHYLTTNLLISTLLDFPPVKMGETGGRRAWGVRFDGYRVSVWVNKKSGEMTVGNGFHKHCECT